jgi:integrase
MKLNDTLIRNTKPTDKPRKLSDGNGLYLLINPNGSKWWRFRYFFGGKENSLSFGVYPDVPLKLARERRDDARKQVAANKDPSAERKASKVADDNTFGALYLEWLGKHEHKLASVTLAKLKWMIEGFVLPDLEHKPIAELAPKDILTVLRKIEARGTHETAHRTKQRLGQIFRYAVAVGRSERDPTQDLRGVLSPVVTKNRAAITNPAQIGDLLRAIDGYVGQPVTHAALRLAPLLFVRPGELRGALWSEIDLERAEWRISAERTKTRTSHVVPLSKQALKLFREVERLTGSGKHVFPSLLSDDRPMSENTINTALRRLGFTKEEMTGHGFRALASTTLNELGWAPDVIELQLAHKERNKVRAAYNRAERLTERRKMMQEWADHLDLLRRKTRQSD